MEIVSKIRKLLLKAKKFPNLRQEIKKQIVEIASKRKYNLHHKDLQEMNYEPAGQKVFSGTLIPTKYDRNWRKNLKR